MSVRRVKPAPSNLTVEDFNSHVHAIAAIYIISAHLLIPLILSYRKHYVEYLGGLIFRQKIDPWPILESEELELCIRRANMRLPSKYQLTDAIYKDVLRKVSDRCAMHACAISDYFSFILG